MYLTIILFLLTRPPPRSTLFPYTTLFRSKSQFLDYLILMRLNRPIGIFLLLWPTLWGLWFAAGGEPQAPQDRKSTRLNSSHVEISYAVFCLKKKKTKVKRSKTACIDMHNV